MFKLVLECTLGKSEHLLKKSSADVFPSRKNSEKPQNVCVWRGGGGGDGVHPSPSSCTSEGQTTTS